MHIFTRGELALLRGILIPAILTNNYSDALGVAHNPLSRGQGIFVCQDGRFDELSAARHSALL